MRRAERCITHHICDCKAAEIERLRDALMFYAAPVNWSEPIQSSIAYFDHGDVARRVLKEINS